MGTLMFESFIHRDETINGYRLKLTDSDPYYWLEVFKGDIRVEKELLTDLDQFHGVVRKYKDIAYELKDLIIVESFIDHFENMIRDLESYGRTHCCPAWDKSLVDGHEDLNRCLLCRTYFKKLVHSEDYFGSYNVKNCPCDNYSQTYLTGFLRSIVKNSLKYHKEKTT